MSTKAAFLGSVKPGIAKTFTSRPRMKFLGSTKGQSRHDPNHLASYLKATPQVYFDLKKHMDINIATAGSC